MNLMPVFKVVRYAFRAFPVLHFAVALSVVSVVAELAAMASLFPLAEMAAGRTIAPASPWNRVVALLGSQTPILSFVWLFLGLLVFRIGSAAAVALFHAAQFRRMIAYFSANAFAAFVEHLEFRDIQEKSIGHFIAVAGEEANRASQIVLSVLRLIPTTLLALLYFGALAMHSLPVGILVFIFLGSTGVAMIGALRRSHRLGIRQQDESRALNTFFIDSLNGLRTVRGFNSERYVASRYRQMIDKYAKTCFAVDAVNILGRALPVLILLVAGLCASMLWLHEETIARHLAFVMATAIIVLRFFPLVGQALDTFMRLTADLRAGQNVAQVVEIAQQAASDASIADDEEILAIREIEFKEVAFSYATDIPILQGLCMRFQAGKTYAVVGPSGAGKSTLIDLLLAFHAPAVGTILINGRNLDTISPRALRARIGMVEQQSRLLSDTVRNNLSFGRPFATAQMASAVRAAQIEGLIESLPLGYESMIAYQGSNLSGGQRQRIGIARALLLPTDVLILDESTAGLDAPTRDLIVAQLKEMYKDRILIFLTHDRELIAHVDEVIRLDKSVARSQVEAIAGEDQPETLA
jgi:ABC-type bacteriocin/lantibiotic exporter with double-glycine peptidase domain